MNVAVFIAEAVNLRTFVFKGFSPIIFLNN